jgi:hypothetical protein
MKTEALPMRFPISIDHRLQVRIGSEVARLSPRQGFDFAERLIRASARRMVVEASAAAEVALPQNDRKISDSNR